MLLQIHLPAPVIPMEVLRKFWNSPVGPKTAHFWGPAVNWGIPIAVCIISLKFVLDN